MSGPVPDAPAPASPGTGARPARPGADPTGCAVRTPGGPGELLADLAAVAAAVALVVAAALAGWQLIAAKVNIFLNFPPLLAAWVPHTGPGTMPAVALAAAVVTQGPAVAARLAWRPLLALGWAVGSAWTLALALVDGWDRGVVGRLTSGQEYLSDVPGVHDVGLMLRTFTDHVLTDQPVHWATHVGGHPVGAFLVFVGLDRVGLGGGGPAGLLCVVVGSSAACAIAVTVRALGGPDGEALARRVLPFAALTPAAVWIGVSADGLFTGVLAWSTALLAVGATARGPRADLAAVAGGLLGGYTVYLSYGLVLGGLLPLVVVLLTRRVRPVLLGVAGGLVVVAAFTAAGFWWFTGYRLVKIIYALSIAKDRPDEYFWWSNLAAVMFLLGPAVLAGLRRALTRPRSVPLVVGALVAAGVLAIALADASGLSKGEVERIWLPFAVWPVAACALLPTRQARWWLAGQALLALAVNHLLWTVW